MDRGDSVTTQQASTLQTLFDQALLAWDGAGLHRLLKDLRIERVREVWSKFDAPEVTALLMEIAGPAWTVIDAGSEHQVSEKLSMVTDAVLEGFIADFKEGVSPLVFFEKLKFWVDSGASPGGEKTGIFSMMTYFLNDQSGNAEQAVAVRFAAVMPCIASLAFVHRCLDNAN